MKKVLREPLVHFLALALAIFIVYGALNRSDRVTPDRIVVTQARIEQIATLFARTWQRPPSPSELKGLIDDYVKDEVYYREALKLGLEADDTVIRRRLRQKMEFLSDAASETLNPTEAELAEYLNAHADKFAVEHAVAFRQIYFNPERRGDKASDDATNCARSPAFRSIVGSRIGGRRNVAPLRVAAHVQSIHQPDLWAEFRRRDH